MNLFESTYARAGKEKVFDRNQFFDAVHREYIRIQNETARYPHRFMCGLYAKDWLKANMKPCTMFGALKSDRAPGLIGQIYGIDVFESSIIPEHHILIMSKDNEVLYIIDTTPGSTGQGDSVPDCGNDP